MNVFVVLLLTAAVAILSRHEVASAPIQKEQAFIQQSQKLKYQIISENSGRFVSVIRSGRVHAHASKPSKILILILILIM